MHLRLIKNFDNTFALKIIKILKIILRHTVGKIVSFLWGLKKTEIWENSFAWQRTGKLPFFSSFCNQKKRKKKISIGFGSSCVFFTSYIQKHWNVLEKNFKLIVSLFFETFSSNENKCKISNKTNMLLREREKVKAWI